MANYLYFIRYGLIYYSILQYSVVWLYQCHRHTVNETRYTLLHNATTWPPGESLISPADPVTIAIEVRHLPVVTLSDKPPYKYSGKNPPDLCHFTAGVFKWMHPKHRVVKK
ncbi:hypothetical protein [Morganella sp. GD04133]|uniref:hypothetical protein n=1 Tax=Morganella sp. GD04133 TaxID=2975435 RepID=UPI002447781C|nr:hypothetical protein [Morganella sp. GD04133]MDH0355949.1 hypothetical protein [Morganella sp. GD04133]